MQILPIDVMEITTENFAPYGRVLEPHTDFPTKSGENWRCFSDVDRLRPDSELMAGIVYCNAIPDVITGLEAHTSREELLWSTDRDILMVVAEPDDLEIPERKPDSEKTKVFLIKAGQAVIIGKGVWHSPAFSADGKEAKYFFLVEAKEDSIDQDAAPWISFKNGVGITAIR